MKLEYKPVAIQDECWGGSKKSPELIVLVKMMAQGTKFKYYKNEAMAFPNAAYLDKYISDNSLKVIPEAEFKATTTEKVLHLLKALKK